MRKVVLLDKRTSRQKESLEISGVALSELNSIDGLANLTGNDSNEFLLELKNGNSEVLNAYSLFILHESDLTPIDLKIISEDCSTKGKSLILFSGSIQQNLFNNEGFDNLSINSKSLYSDKLIEFVKGYITGRTQHITELIYGANWELNYALIYRQLMIDIENGDDFINDGIDNKRDILEACESIIGKKTRIELDEFINRKIRML
jgi:hypothetical protein